MVLSKAATTSAKRKKDADMPESPPKRVTRSRAKAAGENEPQSKVTKITTESAKVSAVIKRRVAPAKPTKRKTRADVANVDRPTETCAEEAPKEDPAKMLGRQTQIMDEGKKKPLKVKVPATTKGRSAKPLVSKEIGVEGPRPRGRPRKAPSTTNDETVASKGPDNAVMVKKSVRGRAAAIVPKPSTVYPVAHAIAARKKVKFDDVDEKDKENVPLQAKALNKPATRATGVKAKPIRKPTSAKTTRGRKVKNEEIDINKKESAEPPRSQPLSPKKVIQIAMSNSVSSEDELCGEKTPVRALSRSPVKPPMSPIREIDNSVSKLDFGSLKAPSSPERVMPSNVLASPARRPPPSPFKNALKGSPKRVNLGDSVAQVACLAQCSPAKSSLLQSPARRPAASMLNHNAPASTVKSGPAMPLVDTLTASKQTKPSSFTVFSSEEAASSPLRALGSSGQSFKVHKMTALEHEAESDEARDTSGQSSPFQSDAAQKILQTSLPVAEPVDFDAHSIQDLSSSPTPTIETSPVNCQKLASQTTSEEIGTANKLQPATTTLQPPVSVMPAFSAFSLQDSESEDELTFNLKSYAPTPLGSHSDREYRSTTSTSVLTRTGAKTRISRGSETELSMTPLATQLSTWLASSPEKKTSVGPSERKRGFFSPVGPTLFDRPERSQIPGCLESPPKYSFFEDEMDIREDDENDFTQVQSINQDVSSDVAASQESQISEQYGDENAMPLDPLILAPEPTSEGRTSTCTPAKVFLQPREIHTISKVPLRPAGEDSTIKIPRKRSRSLAGPLTVVESPENYEFGSGYNDPTSAGTLSLSNDAAPEHHVDETHVTPVKALANMPQTPRTGISDLGSPMRTIRKRAAPNVLKGAVVYVDVHTAEGADASGIFLELLAQMGARCVKQWLWNPRSGSSSSGDDASNTPPDAETPGGKTGITHVVYKDGGKRTLEKVREAKGVVLCVGVGWVLDCEREDRWLDESGYAIDTSLIPRGGHNRRKSMEPKALSNLNGSLIPAATASARTNDHTISPTKEFLTFGNTPTPPTSRRETFIPHTPTVPSCLSHEVTDAVLRDVPSPTPSTSPTTPYYLRRGAELVQKTCPPKPHHTTGGQSPPLDPLDPSSSSGGPGGPSRFLFFPLSGRIEDQPDEAVRHRLMLARRKSLQWVPKVSSPLGRAVSYGYTGR
ncbi:hypothetical protein MMC07_002938 [Pseudocyphellaria aurata]|nr:hypothetical protein [Pseudocyphellaria aurata]